MSEGRPSPARFARRPLPVGEGSSAVLPSPTGRRAGDEGARVKLPLPPDLLAFARSLRKQQPDAEQLMWLMLRNRRFLNWKFKRQHSFPPYILDFFCEDLKLAVELDGGQHNEVAGQAKDEGRSIYLRSRGIEIARYWNNDVLQNLDAVLEDLMARCVQRASPSPGATRHPLPEGEGLGDDDE